MKRVNMYGVENDEGDKMMSYRLLHLDLVNLDAVKFVFKLVVENEFVSVVDVSTLQQHENHQTYD